MIVRWEVAKTCDLRADTVARKIGCTHMLDLQTSTISRMLCFGIGFSQPAASRECVPGEPVVELLSVNLSSVRNQKTVDNPVGHVPQILSIAWHVVRTDACVANCSDMEGVDFLLCHCSLQCCLARPSHSVILHMTHRQLGHMLCQTLHASNN